MNHYDFICNDIVVAETEEKAFENLAERLASNNMDLTTLLKAVMHEEDDNDVIADTLNEIACADDRTDYDSIGNVMFNLLTDEEVKTYDMWEVISVAYRNAESDSFRRGMDKMASILLWKSVKEIAKTICEEVEK